MFLDALLVCYAVYRRGVRETSLYLRKNREFVLYRIGIRGMPVHSALCVFKCPHPTFLIVKENSVFTSFDLRYNSMDIQIVVAVGLISSHI